MNSIDRLVDFARKYHGGFAQVTIDETRLFFQIYAATTIVYQERGEILGFAVYTERDDNIVFVLIAVKKEGPQNWRAVPIFMAAIECFKDRQVCYLDEKLKIKVLKLATGNNSSGNNNRRSLGRARAAKKSAEQGTGQGEKSRRVNATKATKL